MEFVQEITLTWLIGENVKRVTESILIAEETIDVRTNSVLMKSEKEMQVKVMW